MSREQTILEMEFEVAMAVLTRVWDELEKTEVADLRVLFPAINDSAKAWRNLQMERKLLAQVMSEIGR